LAFETARDAHVAVGLTAASEVRFRQATEGQVRIIPTGDRPLLYAYSDAALTPQMLNEFSAGTLLLIVYGHIEYTDFFSQPRPNYVTEFCTGLVHNARQASEAQEACKGHTNLK